MYRPPVFLIIGLVLSSMLTAVLIWQSGDKKIFGEASFASKNPPATTPSAQSLEQNIAQQEAMIMSVEAANTKIQSVQGADTGRSQSNDMTCAVCNIGTAGQGSEDFAFETEQSCRAKSKEKRLYFKKEYELMPDIFKVTRDPKQVSAEFPRECVTYIMRHAAGVPSAIKGKASPRAKYYSKCDTHEGEPTRYEWPLCITEEYVNSVYYAFTDVLSCFGLPQKALLPKLFQESGMHINALGPGLDAGIGQLTGGARPTQKAVASLEREINTMAATNPACARVQRFINESNARYASDQEAYKLAKKEQQKNSSKNKGGKQKKQAPALKPPVGKIDLQYFVDHSGTANRCELIEPPENPFLNVFYMAAKLRDDEKTIETYFSQKVEFTVTVESKSDPKMSGKGKTKKAAATANKSVSKTVVKSYDLKQMIVASGLSKQNVDEIVKRLTEMANIHAYNMGPRGATDLVKNFFKAKLSKGLKVSESDFDFHINEKTLKKNVKTKKDANLTYPEFVYKYYPDGIGGAKAYLVQMAGHADRLNKAFKEGTCVPSGFLRL